ncbi:T9SS type A sorting domain-containing protein, partial [candidate division GN15 bacterium]|nr:T9SS type A sorting domain-containing protein [candidate division GN15 bacterium]
VQPDGGFSNGPGLTFGLAASNDMLYIGGRFVSTVEVPSSRIVGWDGTVYHALGGGLGGPLVGGTAVEVYDIDVAGSDVYVAGSFGSADQPDLTEIDVYNLARWDGEMWHPMGNFNAPVRAIYARGGELYAGGDFTMVDGTAINKIARWDGSQWVAIGEGIWGEALFDAQVYEIDSDGETLWAVGRFSYAGDKMSSGIARWTYCTAPPPFDDGAGATADVSGTSVTLTWGFLKAGLKATTYRLQVDTSSDFTSPVVDVSDIGTTSYTVDSLAENTQYSWRVQMIEDTATSGWSSRLTFETSSPTDVEEEVLDGLPGSFVLSQNYPNPFNPTTTISYSLPTRSVVSLVVYDITGRQVVTLSEGTKPAGQYEITWDGENETGEKVASGVYLYRLEAGDFVQSRKMLLLK